MIPKEVFNRRHFGTPEVVSLIVVNYIVTVIDIQAFAMCTTIKWYFWLVLVLLGVYNFYRIRRNPEEFDRRTLIAYGISWILLLAVFFLLRTKAQPC